MRSPWIRSGVIALAVLAILGGALWGLAAYSLERAVLDLNREISGKLTAQQVIGISLSDNARALSQLAKPDALLFLPGPEVSKTIQGAMALALQKAKLPVAIEKLEIIPGEQGIEFKAAISGTDQVAGVGFKGRFEGVATFRFHERDLLIRAAARRLVLDSVSIPGWTWLSRSIVRLLSPLISGVVASLNGEIPEIPLSVLPRASHEQKITLGAEQVVIPEIVPRPPALLVDTKGVYVMIQIVGAVGSGESPSTYEDFRKAFLAKAGTRFKKSPDFPSGFTFADAFIDQVLGPYRAPASLEAAAKAAVRLNAKALTEMRGPDVVVRLSNAETKEFIGSSLVAAVARLRTDDFSIEDPQQSLDDGVIGVAGKLKTATKYGNGQLVRAEWIVSIAAIPAAEDDGTSLSLTPKVQKAALLDISISGGAPDFSFIIPALNAAVDNASREVNRVIPRIPVKLPVVSPEEVKINGLTAAGINGTIKPDRFVPLGVSVSRAVVAASSSGIWILADVDATEGRPVPVSVGTTGPAAPNQAGVVIAAIPSPGDPGVLPLRPPIGTGIIDPDAATAQSLDIAIEKTIRLRYGDLPGTPIYAMASWKRFAALFNAQWQRLAPRVSVEFDTGTLQLETQRINLLDYARFECKRTRECQRNSCQQRSCSIRGCQRPSCGSCPNVELKSCAFGGCVVWYRGPDQACRAAQLPCNTAAEASVAACNITANSEKAACDASAVAEKAGCDIREEAALFDCNRLAEQEVAFCHTKKLLTNGVAEVGGVGAIGGDARARGQLTVDLAYIVLNEDRPEVALLPILDGSIRGDLGLDWTPYDVIGHIFVCPTRGKVFVNSTATLARSQPHVVASLVIPEALRSPASASPPPDNAASVPNPHPLVVKVDAFKVPASVEPGILNSLYRDNPQIAVTCPVASGLLGIPGLIIGNSFRAIGEGDIAKLLSTAALAPGLATTAPLIYSAADDKVKAGMGALFGGKFNIPVDGFTQEIRLSNKEMELPGGTIVLSPQLDRQAFRLSVATIRRAQDLKQATKR